MEATNAKHTNNTGKGFNVQLLIDSYDTPQFAVSDIIQWFQLRYDMTPDDAIKAVRKECLESKDNMARLCK